MPLRDRVNTIIIYKVIQKCRYTYGQTKYDQSAECKYYGHFHRYSRGTYVRRFPNVNYFVCTRCLLFSANAETPLSLVEKKKKNHVYKTSVETTVVSPEYANVNELRRNFLVLDFLFFSN